MSAQNLEKLPPVRKMFALAYLLPPLSMQTYHKFRKIISFLDQKVWMSACEESPPLLYAICSHWTNPSPWLRTLLWTALYSEKNLKKSEPVFHLPN